MEIEADHLEGFEELLNMSGRLLLFGTEHFRAVIKTLEPPAEAYDLAPTENDSVLITAFRNEIPSAAVKVGISLTDSDGFFYRVSRLKRSPNHPLVKLECTVLNP